MDLDNPTAIKLQLIDLVNLRDYLAASCEKLNLSREHHTTLAAEIDGRIAEILEVE